MASKLIIVTGFGPFRGHEQVNPSWEAVKLLPESLEFKGSKFSIRKIEVPVVYEDVQRALKEIWSLDPFLVIHCGVNGKINCISLESNARNGVFCDPDFAGQRLPCTTAPLCNNTSDCPLLETRLDVLKIAEELNGVIPGNVISRSSDVGNYLCCFIYLNSLDQCTGRSLFIHVPPISEQFSPEFVSNCIQQVILKSISQRLQQLEK